MEAKDYVLALKDRGMTQVQIEKETGIPQPTISKIERGDVSDVMSKTYRALQAAYNAMRCKRDDDLGGCIALHRTMVGDPAVSVKPGSVVQPPKLVQQ